MSGSNGIRVVLVDDHAMVAESVRRALGLEPDIDVVGVAGSVCEGVELVLARRPDIVLLDHRLPDAVGAPAIRRMLVAAPDVRIIAFTGHGDAEIAAAAFAAGARGYIDKGRSLATLADAIRTVAAGATFSALPSEPVPAAGRAVPDEQPRLLTPRELEVLHLVGDGVATRDVAARLGISQHTVRKHVQTILGKLDAHSKLEGVARARRLGLLDRTGPADLDD